MFEDAPTTFGRSRLPDLLEAFLQAMRHELGANDRKGDWATLEVHRYGQQRVVSQGKPLTTEAMLQSLAYHVAKLAVAIELEHPGAIREYCADVANEAMIVADLAGVVGHAPSEHPTLLMRDVVFHQSIDEVPRAWAEKESDEPSGLSGELMDFAKEFARAAAAAGRTVADNPQFSFHNSVPAG